jgi:hypothetical protein
MCEWGALPGIAEEALMAASASTMADAVIYCGQSERSHSLQHIWLQRGDSATGIAAGTRHRAALPPSAAGLNGARSCAC